MNDPLWSSPTLQGTHTLHTQFAPPPPTSPAPDTDHRYGGHYTVYSGVSFLHPYAHTHYTPHTHGLHGLLDDLRGASDVPNVAEPTHTPTHTHTHTSVYPEQGCMAVEIRCGDAKCAPDSPESTHSDITCSPQSAGSPRTGVEGAQTHTHVHMCGGSGADVHVSATVGEGSHTGSPLQQQQQQQITHPRSNSPSSMASSSSARTHETGVSSQAQRSVQSAGSGVIGAAPRLQQPQPQAHTHFHLQGFAGPGLLLGGVAPGLASGGQEHVQSVPQGQQPPTQSSSDQEVMSHAYAHTPPHAGVHTPPHTHAHTPPHAHTQPHTHTDSHAHTHPSPSRPLSPQAMSRTSSSASHTHVCVSQPHTHADPGQLHTRVRGGGGGGADPSLHTLHQRETERGEGGGRGGESVGVGADASMVRRDDVDARQNMPNFALPGFQEGGIFGIALSFSVEDITVGKEEESEDASLVISVTAPLRSWKVTRSLSELYALHHYLHRHIMALEGGASVELLPPLPPDTRTSTLSEAEGTEMQMAALQAYLQDLIEVPMVWASPAMLAFFEDESSGALGMHLIISQLMTHVRRVEGECQALQAEVMAQHKHMAGQQSLLESLSRRVEALETGPPASTSTTAVPGWMGAPVTAAGRATTGAHGDGDGGGGGRGVEVGGGGGGGRGGEAGGDGGVGGREHATGARSASSYDMGSAGAALYGEAHIMRDRGLSEPETGREACVREGVGGGGRGSEGGRGVPMVPRDSDTQRMTRDDICEPIARRHVGGMMGIAPSASPTSFPPGMASIMRGQLLPQYSSPPETPPGRPSPSSSWDRMALPTTPTPIPITTTTSSTIKPYTSTWGPTTHLLTPFTASPSAHTHTHTHVPTAMGMSGGSSVGSAPYADPMSEQVIILPLALIPTNDRPSALDARVEELIRLVGPSAAAEAHRQSLFDFVRQLVRRALGAHCFAVGPFANKTYLPDDELGISAFLCRGQENSWFIRVNEMLCKVSALALLKGHQPMGGQALSSSWMGSDALDGLDTSEFGLDSSLGESSGGGDPLLQSLGASTASTTPLLIVTNVNFVNAGKARKVRCVVEDVGVDISSNQIRDLWTVAFLEEVDTLLGRNHLFKRSVLLLKAWCLYESRAFEGYAVQTYLDDMSLTVMMLAVVNAHHTRLFHPLQALALFFHTYSVFDWNKYCVCVDGPRALTTLGLSDPSTTTSPPLSTHTHTPLSATHTHRLSAPPGLEAAFMGGGSMGGGGGMGVGASAAVGLMDQTGAPPCSSTPTPPTDPLRAPSLAGGIHTTTTTTTTTSTGGGSANVSTHGASASGSGTTGGGASTPLISVELLAKYRERYNACRPSPPPPQKPPRAMGQGGSSAASDTSDLDASMGALAFEGGGVLDSRWGEDLRGSSSVFTPQHQQQQQQQQQHSSMFPTATTTTIATSTSTSSLNAANIPPGGAMSALSRAQQMAGSDYPSEFLIRAMNVMNPLDPQDNLVGPTISRRRALRVRQLFQVGARTLKPVLLRLQDELRRQASGLPVTAMPPAQRSTALLDTFFSYTLARFGKGWRPDVPQHDHQLMVLSTVPSSTSTPSPVLEGDLTRLQEQLQYCSLLLESEVTPSALRTLSVEILSERGPLPVGEIGKLLQEATANPSLSSTLKDKFGGLKKFLEKYDADFFISNNHPFNPHVYLKSALTIEDLAIISAGGALTPGQSKKSRKAAKKRHAAQQEAQRVQMQQATHIGIPLGTTTPGTPINMLTGISAQPTPPPIAPPTPTPSPHLHLAHAHAHTLAHAHHAHTPTAYFHTPSTTTTGGLYLPSPQAPVYVISSSPPRDHHHHHHRYSSSGGSGTYGHQQQSQSRHHHSPQYEYMPGPPGGPMYQAPSGGQSYAGPQYQPREYVPRPFYL